MFFSMSCKSSRVPGRVTLSPTEPQFHLFLPMDSDIEVLEFNHILKSFVPRSIVREMRQS